LIRLACPLSFGDIAMGGLVSVQRFDVYAVSIYLPHTLMEREQSSIMMDWHGLEVAEQKTPEFVALLF
jgi:hypothetical protein